MSEQRRVDDVKFLVVAGLIGAGKTWLTEVIAERGGVWVVRETRLDRALLKPFYEGQPGAAARLQYYATAQRIAMAEIVYYALPRLGAATRCVVMDTGLACTRAFEIASGLGDAERTHLRDVLDEQLGEAGLLNGETLLNHGAHYVYLYVTPEIAMKRIYVRAREAERDMSLAYLQRLSALHLEHALRHVHCDAATIKVLNNCVDYVTPAMAMVPTQDARVVVTASRDDYDDDGTHDETLYVPQWDEAPEHPQCPLMFQQALDRQARVWQVLCNGGMVIIESPRIFAHLDRWTPRAMGASL